jgi:hypothetical protein
MESTNYSTATRKLNHFVFPSVLSGASASSKSETPFQEIFLSYDEVQSLRRAFSKLTILDCRHALALQPILSQTFRAVVSEDKVARLDQFASASEHMLVVRHLPIDEILPPTPCTRDLGLYETSLATASILGIFGCIGIQPLAYQGENDDSFIRHVVPKRRAEGTLSSYGSRLDLGMHVDNPHLPLIGEPVQALSACPEFLSLTGVRCELAVPTRLLSVQEVLESLPPEVIHVLQQPLYTIKRPESFSEQRYRLVAPLVLQDSDGRYLCRYNKANVEANTREALDALTALEHAIQQYPVQRVLLQQGDMLIFKNQQTFHARDAFTPRFDGLDRWMIRVFGIRDMGRTIPVHADQPYIVRA